MRLVRQVVRTVQKANTRIKQVKQVVKTVLRVNIKMKQVNQVVNIALQENGLLQVLVLVQIVLRVINVMEPELKLNVQADIMLHQVPALAIVVPVENIVIQGHQVVQVAQADGHIVNLVLLAVVQVVALDIHYLVEAA